MNIFPHDQVLFNVHIAFLVLSVLFVVLRFTARILHRREPLTSDWVIFASQVCFIAYTAVVFSALDNPYGTVDVTLIPSEAWQLYITKRLLANEYLTTISITLSKLSLLLFYLEVFSTRPFRLVNHAVCALVAAWFLAALLLLTLPCGTHTRGLWDLTARAHSPCASLTTVLIAYETSNIAVDLCVLVLPLYNLRRLQLTRARKLALTAVFSLGGFVIVTSILRLSPIIRNPAGPIPLPATFIWTSVQSGSAIVCSCAPTLFPLLSLGRPGPRDTSVYRRVRSRSALQVRDGAAEAEAEAEGKESGEEVGWREMLVMRPPGAGEGEAKKAKVAETERERERERERIGVAV